MAWRFRPHLFLALPLSAAHRLEPFVEACLMDGVALIAVCGEGCGAIEDLIDEIVVGNGSDDSRHITSSAYEGETLEEVIEFARYWVTEDGRQGAQVVRL